jgi:hypothetical protein
VRGIEFTMGGRWVITVTLGTPTEPDRVTLAFKVG